MIASGWQGAIAIGIMTMIVFISAGCASSPYHERNLTPNRNNYWALNEEINKLMNAKDKSDSNRKRQIEISEAFHVGMPKSDLQLHNLGVLNEELKNWSKAAYWFEKLLDLLEKEGLVKCGYGKTRSAIRAAENFWKSGEIEKARAFAERTEKFAKKIGDDQPDCSYNKFTHDDVWVRAEAAKLQDRMNTTLKPNPVTVMASGPANRKYVNSIGQEFIYIPSGSFTMGDDATPETMRHKVNLTRGYYLQKTEVTQEQWQNIMASNPSYYKGKNNPVTGVTIADIQVFISKLNDKERTLFYRLPTEAEWEYAARAGTDSVYYFGNDAKMFPQFAWYDYNSGARSHPVATRHPNQWGLYDMLGNVSELVSDFYKKDYFAISPAENPQGPLTGDSTVYKGYSFNDGPVVDNGSAGRHPFAKDMSFSNVGFRLAYEPLSAEEMYKKVHEINSIDGYEAYLKLYPQENNVSEIQKKISILKEDTIKSVEMVPVKGGCFQMGDSFGDGIANEKPLHEVCVSDFSIGKYEVTQAQWEKVMKFNPSTFKKCGDDCPVESVSWEDAQMFIKKLNRLTGRKYRLPTEAEWEYAARSGGKNEKYAGADAADTVAWYDDNSGKTAHKVGTKRSNRLGLYDMNGNVSEWCQDWFGEGYYGRSPKSDPQGPASSEKRVWRGGSWFNNAGLVRTSYRDSSLPSERYTNIGFRLVHP